MRVPAARLEARRVGADAVLVGRLRPARVEGGHAIVALLVVGRHGLHRVLRVEGRLLALGLPLPLPLPLPALAALLALTLPLVALLVLPTGALSWTGSCRRPAAHPGLAGRHTAEGPSRWHQAQLHANEKVVVEGATHCEPYDKAWRPLQPEP